MFVFLSTYESSEKTLVLHLQELAMKRMVVSETLANPNKDHLNEHIFQNSHMFASGGRKSLNETE